jgi:hypothetical protein
VEERLFAHRRDLFTRLDLVSTPPASTSRAPAAKRSWNAGQEGAFTKPDKLHPHHLSCADTILNLERQPAWVLLLSIENDPSYKKLMDELLDQIEPLTQPSHPGMRQR